MAVATVKHPNLSVLFFKEDVRSILPACIIILFVVFVVVDVVVSGSNMRKCQILLRMRKCQILLLRRALS